MPDGCGMEEHMEVEKVQTVSLSSAKTGRRDGRKVGRHRPEVRAGHEMELSECVSILGRSQFGSDGENCRRERFPRGREQM